MKTAYNAEIRALMDAYGLTQATVARLLEVHPKTVESWMATPGAAHYRTARRSWLTLLSGAVLTHRRRQRAIRQP